MFQKEIISDFSEYEVPNLDPGQSYCFMVAAHIPSRPKSSQQGALSGQLCTHEDSDGTGTLTSHDRAQSLHFCCKECFWRVIFHEFIHSSLH